jgi:hypothetical protein
MAGQLIPPPGLEPPAPERLTADQRVALWLDLMDSAEELLLAGLRRDVGPCGDVAREYRRWCEQQGEEHDLAVRRLADNLYRRGVRHGR